MTQPPPPPTMINYATPASRPRPDRRGWLIAAGVLLILLGALCGCMAAVMPFSVHFAPRPAGAAGPGAGVPNITTGALVGVVLLYVGFATALIWTGVGACRCRRWTRPVVLAVGWPVMVIGAATLVMVAFVLPEQMQLQAAARAASAAPKSLAPPAWAIAAILFVSGLIYVGLPGAFIFLFRQQATARTLAHYDPRRYWTDRLPTPVLTILLGVGLVALAPLSLLNKAALPAFGTYLHGPAAVAAVLGLTAVAVLTLVWVWKLRTAGWWLALLILVVPAVSFVITLAVGGTAEYYRQMGLPPEQVAAVGKSAGVIFGVWPAITLAWVGFLIYCRRFFGGVGTAAGGLIESGEGEIRTPGTV